MKPEKRYRKRKCLHCKRWYTPHPRAVSRQKFCTRTECQKARRRRISRKWRRLNYFETKPSDITRIRVWRSDHPGYWRKHRRRWLIMELFVPALQLKKNRIWTKLSYPKVGALRIVNLVQDPDRPCLVKILLDALRISMDQMQCHCYRPAKSEDCPLHRPKSKAVRQAGVRRLEKRSWCRRKTKVRGKRAEFRRRSRNGHPRHRRTRKAYSKR